jgi:5-methylcytosine-specific restriction endonuclease McrA
VSAGWSGGSTRRWRKTRDAVLQRDGYSCRLRLSGCTGTATHVHHTRGKAAGDEPAFLIAACEHCNLLTGDPTQHDPQPRPLEQW